MFGLIGKIIATEGNRDRLIDIMLKGMVDMPGCLSYIIAKAPEDQDAIWITEVWNNKENHASSLKLTAVQKVIEKARPFIAGFGERFETEPLGGIGLKRPL